MSAALGGVFGIAGLAAFISAIPLSYQIEARSDPRKAGRRSGYTNIWAVALNIGVARDAETQALRSRVLKRLLVVAACFGGIALTAVSR